MLKRIVVLAALVAALAAPASAAPLFLDNFDSEHGGVGVLNYAGFANFTISNGTVDLIGNGFFSFPPVTNGHGLYVDLDGSTSNAGLMLANPIAIGPGTYALSFELAGNQRNAGNDTVDVQIFFNSVPFMFGTFVLGATDPFTVQTALFGTGAPGNLTFSFHNRGGDNIGALLDNIQLDQTNAVPEPASLVLLGTGIASAIAARRRRRG